MEPHLFLEMAAVENTHWWFVGRRAVIDKALSRLKLPADAEILEAGCGTGGNLAMLGRYGRVYGMELDDNARDLARARGIGEVAAGRLPEAIPFPDRNFDLIVLIDVLEHVDDDLEVLRSLRRRLKPGGRLLITVPAYRFLWSRHDVMHHHKRRYTMKQLRGPIVQAGCQPQYSTHFNMWFLPLMAASRLWQRLSASSCADGRQVPARAANWLLAKIFSSERLLVGSVSLPVGGSLLLIARAR
jgi:SAM-dependent methyltransferase